jgi:hypothetical protein
MPPTRQKPADTKPDPTQSEINGWPSKVALAKELEIPIRRLNNWVTRKHVRTGVATDGSTRLCRADAEEMKAEQDGEEDEETEVESEAMHLALEAAKVSQSIASDAQQHILALYKLVPEPSHKVMGLLESTVVKQAERIKHLEDTQQDLIEMREEFKSAQHMRDLELRRFEAQQVRRQEIWEGFKKKAGPLLAAQLAKNGVRTTVASAAAGAQAAVSTASTSDARVGNAPAAGNTEPGPAGGGNTPPAVDDLPTATAEEQEQIAALRGLLRTAQLGGQLEMMKQLDGFVTPEQIVLIDTILSRAPAQPDSSEKPADAEPKFPEEPVTT